MKKKTASPNTKYVVRRGISGLGLFATEAFKRGDFIIEYTGELISTEEADRRGGQYLFVVSDTKTIDGKGRANIARYVNHSCKPNAEAELDEDELRVRIYAKKKILPGEEILYDYGQEFWDEHIRPYGCRCLPCAHARHARPSSA